MTRVNWSKDHARKLSARAVQHSIEKARNDRIDRTVKTVEPTVDLLPPMHTLAPATMSSTVMIITPELATKWLEGNTHNRPLLQRNVTEWAKDMATGRWVLNGESIIFDATGKLADGQHRLWACVESGATFESIVVFGAPVDAFVTIDQGKRRNPADHMVVAGVTSGKYRTVFAAIVALLYRYENNQMFSNEKIRPDQLVATAKANPGLEDWCAKCRRGPAKLQGFATYIAFVLHIGSKKYPQEAQRFLEQWVTGADLATGSPILALRQRVLNGAPRHVWERAYIATVAWNSFVRNRPLFKTGTLKSDAFPRILGKE